MNKTIKKLCDKYDTDPNIKIEILDYLNNYIKNKSQLNQFYNSKTKQKFRKLSFKSKFIFNKIMCDFMNFNYGLYSINDNITSIFNLNNTNEKINEILNRDGYYSININSEICNNILKSLNNIYFYERSTKKKVLYNKKYKFVDNTLWINNIDDILNIPDVQNLISDSRLLAIIQNYLMAKPILTQTNIWISKNINSSFGKSAQLYHRDFDHERWIKIFIYLNDIGLDNGPHSFVKGSHNKIVNNNHKIKRESDEYINKNFNKSDIMYFTGKQGTVIIEDTRGYHKGTPVLSGSRYILQLEFAINDCYVNSIPPFNIKKINNSLNEAIKKYPYIYQKIK